MSTALSIPSFPLPGPPSVFGLTRAALGDHLTDHGLPRYRADQIYGWIYQKRHRTPDAMSNLPGTLRSILPGVCSFTMPRVASVRGTADGLTHKVVLELSDGQRVECVSMSWERGLRCSVSCRRVSLMPRIGRA